jgi:PAS domain-containing protein
MRFETTPGFFAATDRTLPRFILTAGILLSLLLYWITRSLATARQSALILAEKMTEDLSRSEENFRTLVGNIPGIIYRCQNDKDYTMEFISEGIEEISGFPSDDFIGNRVRTYASIIHPEDLALVERLVNEGVATDAVPSGA